MPREFLFPTLAGDIDQAKKLAMRLVSSCAKNTIEIWYNCTASVNYENL